MEGDRLTDTPLVKCCIIHVSLQNDVWAVCLPGLGSGRVVHGAFALSGNRCYALASVARSRIRAHEHYPNAHLQSLEIGRSKVGCGWLVFGETRFWVRYGPTYHPHETPSSSPPPFCFAPAPFCFAPAKNLLRPRRSSTPPAQFCFAPSFCLAPNGGTAHSRHENHDFRVDCELCRHWGLSRRTGAKQNCVGGVEDDGGEADFLRGRSRTGRGRSRTAGAKRKEFHGGAYQA
ncbi:hypothetical protein Bbelb_311290 [Branchiostoma belcheri]|nr:hypothetical protein Bbelb_311290 [Branchiostoma belcheri]